jgi:hypothetical protein
MGDPQIEGMGTLGWEINIYLGLVPIFCNARSAIRSICRFYRSYHPIIRIEYFLLRVFRRMLIKAMSVVFPMLGIGW